MGSGGFGALTPQSTECMRRWNELQNRNTTLNSTGNNMWTFEEVCTSTLEKKIPGHPPPPSPLPPTIYLHTIPPSLGPPPPPELLHSHLHPPPYSTSLILPTFYFYLPSSRKRIKRTIIPPPQRTNFIQSLTNYTIPLPLPLPPLLLLHIP